MENRAIVKKYFLQNLTPSQIFERVKSIGITRSCVYRTIQRLRETGSIQDRPRSGRPRSARTKEQVARVRSKIWRNPARSAGTLAKEERTSRSSMQGLLKEELHLKPYKKRKRHGLTDNQRRERVKRSKLLLKRYGGESLENIVFSDEKLFNTEIKLNAQNDRIYALSIEDIPEKNGLCPPFRTRIP